ncbi:MAG: hypothetical protein EA362_12815 [Saprospirales bacterium]|nr:MAG: hypothetical protein EA362_12815 [Saprospirales bacterium]
MIIKNLHIDGFGHFHDFRLGEFSRGLYLIYGKNEAGKSTLMDFIRMTLLGYERLHEKRRPPLKGGNHGGYIKFEDSNEKLWEIHRSGSGRQDNYTLINIDTNERTDDDPRYKNIISHASSELFNNIYAIGLEELFAFESIDKSGMKDQIYSLGLGLGSMNIGEFEKNLISHAEEWYKHRARTAGSNELLKVLNELEGRLHGSSKIVDHYDQLYLQRKEKIAKRDELQSQSDEINKAKNKIQSLQRTYPDYITYKDSNEKLQQLKHLSEIPNALIQKERDLISNRSNIEKEINDLQSELGELKFKSKQILIDEKLLQHPDKLEFFRTRTELLSSLLDSQSELENSISRTEKSISDTLSEMGQGYNRDTVLNFRNNIELAAAAKKHSELLKTQNGEISRLQYSRDERTIELRRKEQQLHIFNEKIAESGRTLDQLKKKLAEAEVDFSMAIKESSGQKSLPLIGKFALLLLSLFMAIVAVVLWEQSPLLAGIAILLGLVGVIIFFLLLFGSSSDKTGKENLPALQLSISELKEKINDLTESSKNADLLKREIADIVAHIQSLESTIDKLENEKKEAYTKWDDYTAELGLPKGIDSDSIEGLTTNIRRVHELDSQMQQEKRRLNSRKEEIGQFREAIRLFNPSAAEDKNLMLAANEMRRLFEEAFEQKRTKDQLEEEILSIQNRITTAEKRLKDLDTELAEIYARFGAEDRENYLEQLEKSEEKKELINKRDAARSLILSHCGWGELENTIAELDHTDPQSLSEQLADLEKQLKEIEEKIRTLSEEAGGLRTEMESLEKSADKSGLELKLEEKRTEFNEGYLQWLKHKLAATLVGKCRKRYEETRQPSVIQHTSRIFSAITKGRYNNIIVDINGNMEITEDKLHRKSIENLSRGTREQLLLALRMGLIEEYEQGAEPLPVILDDVLVNFDYPRRHETAEQLMKFAQSRQVILFSCHRHMRGLFEELGAKIMDV